MRVLLSYLIIAIAAGTVCGQTIEGPDKVDAGKPAWYSIIGVPEEASAIFFPSEAITFDSAKIVPGNAMFWAPKPGSYSIIATVTTVEIDWQTRRVSIRQIPLAKTIEVTGEAPPVPFPVNPYPTPSQEWLTSVQSISQTTPPKEYSEAKSSQFHKFAASVRTDNVLQTTADLQRLLAEGSSDGGSFPPTRDAVAALIESKLGRTDAELNREEAAAMLEAIAWAIWEAGHE